MYRYSITCLLLSVVNFQPIDFAFAEDRQGIVRLLTIGNELTENATALLDNIAVDRGDELIHKALTIKDSTLVTHHKRAFTPDHPIHGFGTVYSSGETLSTALQSDDWDFVVIQVDHEQSEPRLAREIVSLVHRFAPQADLVVHQTWALRADDPQYTSSINKDSSFPKNPREMFLLITDACESIATEVNARLIPSGQAFFSAERDTKYGYRPDPSLDLSSFNYPTIPQQEFSLHAGYEWDKTQGTPTLRLNSHRASQAGQYLASCIWYACLFNVNPTAIEYTPDGLDQEYATFLKSIAASTLKKTAGSLSGKRSVAIVEDPQPKRHTFRVRASEVDPEISDYPEIGFTRGFSLKPNDWQYASVDTQIQSKGKLVLWLMGHNEELFKRLNQYGLHAIDVHYARGWFSKLCQPNPETELARGEVRLEAATGLNHSDELDLQYRDGASERARRLLIWLSEKNPTGNWDQFLTPDKDRVRWDKVIVSGASHGSTTAARFAKYQKVNRVVMLCGPRDQDQTWQNLYSATPHNRYFGFTHILDGGWTGDHYCRSWQLLGLQQYGAIIDIDHASPPYSGTRRLISSADVDGDARKAHSAVTPGRSSPTDENGVFLYEPVWKYLYTQPVDQFGSPVPAETDCDLEQDT